MMEVGWGQGRSRGQAGTPHLPPPRAKGDPGVRVSRRKMFRSGYVLTDEGSGGWRDARITGGAVAKRRE